MFDLSIFLIMNKYVFAAVRFWERLLFCTHCRGFWGCLVALLCCTYFRFFVRTASEHLGGLAHQFSVLKAICHKLQKALFPARRGCFLAFFGQFWVFLSACWNHQWISDYHLGTFSGGPTLPESYINRCCVKRVIAFSFPKGFSKLFGLSSFLFFI